MIVLSCLSTVAFVALGAALVNRLEALDYRRQLQERERWAMANVDPDPLETAFRRLEADVAMRERRGGCLHRRGVLDVTAVGGPGPEFRCADCGAVVDDRDPGAVVEGVWHGTAEDLEAWLPAYVRDRAFVQALSDRKLGVGSDGRDTGTTVRT